MSPHFSIYLYAVFALGAVGLYLALPQRGRWPVRTGLILSAAALAGLLAFFGRSFLFTEGTTFYFVVLAGIALVGAVRMITHPKPVYSAILFVMVVLATAGLLLLLRAEFLAMALVIIYAGAILVTYLFVIMLAQQSGAPVYDTTAREPFAAVAAGFLLAATIVGMLGEARAGTGAESLPVASEAADAWEGLPADESAATSHTLAVGATLLTRYVVVFELAGVLLLVAIVGAIALVRRRVEETEWEGPAAGGPVEPPAPGSIGRRVEPF